MSGRPGRMPIVRDVSVKRAPEVSDAPRMQSEAAASRSTPSLVTVMGFDRNDVLFSSDEVGAVQWRDSEGSVAAILVRLKPGIWGFSRRGEDDWDEVMQIYGNPDAR